MLLRKKTYNHNHSNRNTPLMAGDRPTDLYPLIFDSSYRLAPEHVFPVPLDDCVTATKHFMKNAADFGVDANRVVIAGKCGGQ